MKKSFLIYLGSIVINLVGYNFAWFGLVYWGDSFIPISLFLLITHLSVVGKVNGEIWLILVITAIGIFVDSSLQYFNIFIFTGYNHIPFWLMMLWACFAATICHSLRFLSNSKLLQAFVGGLFAPLSYVAGYKFQVVDFSQPVIFTYLMLSVIWAGLFVCFFYLKEYLINNEVSHV
jgi:hypothetical protein